MTRYIDFVGDTICAPVTAAGYAGVSVLRVSGERSLQIVEGLLSPDSAHTFESHHAVLKKIFHPSEGHVLDSALVTYFKEGSSFTGDEVVEIACHGNPRLVQELVDLLVLGGCRLAEKGEFSFRAFHNGKLDLVQAESINQLIHSQSRTAASLALGALDGEFSKVFSGLESSLLRILAHLEASIDFCEQDIDPSSYKDCLRWSRALSSKLQGLVESFDLGKNLTGRWKVALAGATNAGKSSLFNALVGSDVAIVSDIHGTTRDPVVRDLFVGQQSVEFIDTAGFRETAETLEAIGMQKSVAATKESAFVLWVVDGAVEPPDFACPESLQSQVTFLVVNKMDKLEAGHRERLLSLARQQPGFAGTFSVSAKNGWGLATLNKGIQSYLQSVNDFEGQAIVSQARHHGHLSKMLIEVQGAEVLLQKGESPDLIAHHFQRALMEFNWLVGKEYNDEVLDQIFSEFCLGK